MIRNTLFLLAACVLFTGAVAAAQTAPSFIMPAACTLERDCWIINYVDTDPAPGRARDFMCGPRSYDDHHGTDFALRDRLAMEMGVEVRAAADGTVLRVRDHIEDRAPDPEDIERLLAENKACGNGVFIDHGQGWESIYCHLKQGSIAVKPDQEVKEGDIIARIGQSGAAEVPHLHFGLFYRRAVIDPFTGLIHPAADDEPGTTCVPAQGQSLWQNFPDEPDENGYPAPTYQPFSIYAAGFTGQVPDFEAIKIDATPPRTLPAASEALLFWGAFFGVQEGDRIVMEIHDPEGRIFASRAMTQTRHRARQFYYIGKPTPDDAALATGKWHGHIRVTRPHATGEMPDEPLVREYMQDIEIR